MPSPKLEPMVLSEEERSELTEWASRRKTAQAPALRARIVLPCAGGGTMGRVAEQAGTSLEAVHPPAVRGQSRRCGRAVSHLPVMPAAPARMTHDSVRHGTTGLFAAMDIGTGSVIAYATNKTEAVDKWLIRRPASTCTAYGRTAATGPVPGIPRQAEFE
ncbi:hypothetical protein [Actinomadura formosensis]|uniref:hypothetical protein n=1 Tax=Actinomadura formosensis TaxID=60706 RepID=UPI003D9040CF